MNFIAINSRAIGLGVTIALVAGLFPGCGGSSNEPTASDTAAPQADVEKEVPPTPDPAPDAPAPISQAQIAACANMVEWYKLYQDYTETGQPSEDLDTAFAEKEAALLKSAPPQALNEKLSLVAFDWKLNGASSSEGKKEEFTASWLFRKTGETELGPDRRVLLVLRGWVDKAHQEYLKAEGHGDGRYFEKTYTLDPGVDAWEPGTYQLITKVLRPALPNLPYRMHSIFPEQSKTDDGSWDTKGRYAEMVNMGWFADLGN